MVSSTSTTVTLSWDMLDSSVDEYIIEFRAPSKSVAWDRMYELDYSHNTGTITGLDMGTEYEFRLRAETAAGYSAHSEVVISKTDNW